MGSKIDSIFEFYKSNRLIYRSIVEHINSGNGVMPFVGYGLISFNYGAREDFLEFLINENFLNKQKESLLSDDYLESLDNILNELADDEFQDVIGWNVFENYYSAEMIDWYRALHEPINLIQWFNNGSAITTNFDKLYELLNKTPITEIATPTNKMSLNHFLREDASVKSLVFKVHGDLFSDKKNLILTKKQFTDAYTNTEFISKLKQWIEKYILLFVGVDIVKDKYLNLLLEQTRQEGINHYALIACDNNQVEKKKIYKVCTDKGIFPILYDINKPDSVRILLHQLLVDSQNKKWRKTFERGTLHYLFNDQLIVGRDKQINELISFLNDKRGFLYCSISSKNITGKSKLAFDFAHTYATEWRWYMISIHEMNDFLNTQPSVLKKKTSQKKENTLFIFDDYSLYDGSLDDIADFIDEIMSYCKKIRIIFIASDMKESNFFRKKEPKAQVLFKPGISLYKNFYLSLLTVDEIMDVSINYVLFRRKELSLRDNEGEIDSWRNAIQTSLREYIVEIIKSDPQEALLFSMAYAVKLTLNYLHASTTDTDTEYVTNEVFNYEFTEGIGIGINTEKVDKIKLSHNRSIRLDRIAKQFSKINRNQENLSNDMSSFYSNEEAFQNMFNEREETKDITLEEQVRMNSGNK